MCVYNMTLSRIYHRYDLTLKELEKHDWFSRENISWAVNTMKTQRMESSKTLMLVFNYASHDVKENILELNETK